MKNSEMAEFRMSACFLANPRRKLNFFVKAQIYGALTT